MNIAKIFLFCIFLGAINKTFAQLTFPHVSVLYDSIWSYKNLHLIPIRFTDSTHFDTNYPTTFISIETALKKKFLQIKENNFLGRENVNVLNVKNSGKEVIFMLAGTLLKGGKQDRMLGETKLLPPKKEYDFLNVYCIEKGRWDKKPKPFSYAGFAEVGIRKAADSSNIQQQVWKEIEKSFNEIELVSKTYSYLEVQKKMKNNLIDYYTYFKEKFSLSDSLYAGFIVVSDSTIIVCDVFANEKLLTAAFDNLLTSYMNAIKNGKITTQIDSIKIRKFANKLFGNDLSQKKFIEQNGKIFNYNNKPLHIVAYGD